MTELQAMDALQQMLGDSVFGDRFRQNGLRCFGPGAAGAQLEGSKAYTKEFLLRHSIPTAAYATFSDLTEAQNYVHQQGTPIVIKAEPNTSDCHYPDRDEHGQRRFAIFIGPQRLFEIE